MRKAKRDTSEYLATEWGEQSRAIKKYSKNWCQRTIDVLLRRDEWMIEKMFGDPRWAQKSAHKRKHFTMSSWLVPLASRDTSRSSLKRARPLLSHSPPAIIQLTVNLIINEQFERVLMFEKSSRVPFTCPHSFGFVLPWQRQKGICKRHSRARNYQSLEDAWAEKTMSVRNCLSHRDLRASRVSWFRSGMDVHWIPFPLVKVEPVKINRSSGNVADDFWPAEKAKTMKRSIRSRKLHNKAAHSINTESRF